MNELQKRAFVAGAEWAILTLLKYGINNNYTSVGDVIRKEAERRYTPKPTCYDCHWQFDNPFDVSFCQKGFKATRVCKQFKKRGAK